VQIALVTGFLFLFIPMLRTSTPALAAAAAQVLAHSYHAHRSELMNVTFLARNVLLVALFTIVIGRAIRILQANASRAEARRWTNLRRPPRLAVGPVKARSSPPSPMNDATPP
jgi:hypothetical protein